MSYNLSDSAKIELLEIGTIALTKRVDNLEIKISDLYTKQQQVSVEPVVKVKAVEDEEKEYNELFNELNKNFTAYNWFIMANPNSDEAKKRWDKIREIINRFSA